MQVGGVRGCRVGCPEGADWMAPPASYRSTPLLAVYLAMRCFARRISSELVTCLWGCLKSRCIYLMNYDVSENVISKIKFRAKRFVSTSKWTKMYAVTAPICMKILPRVNDYAVDVEPKFQFNQPIRSRVMKFQSLYKYRPKWRSR